MKELQKYIELSKMMILATNDADWNPYTSNVYFWYNPENYKFYFISRITREHSQHIINNKNIAWSIIDTQKYWPTSDDKKALQFQGIAKVLNEEEGIDAYYKYYSDRVGFPIFPKEHFVFECTSTRLKIWDEELYSGDGKIIEL